MPADGLPVVIVELAPPARTVELAGRDRPEQGVKVGSVQRTTQTYYPGTSQASVQVMGTREEPIVLRGWFQDAFAVLVGGGTPGDRIALLRAIQQGGAQCRLIWGDAIVRVGRVARVEADYRQAGRIRYEITFEVDQPSEAPALRPAILGAGVQAALKAALAAASSAAKLAVSTARVVKLVIGVVK